MLVKKAGEMRLLGATGARGPPKAPGWGGEEVNPPEAFLGFIVSRTYISFI